ncbi:MAG: hypothetical protein LPJ91_08285 [Pseudazoarcus pumilus]|nr:hypothetical protein [Pseudazoarcus pumilus]
MNRYLLTIIPALLLTACVSPRFDAGGRETVLPLQRAWFEGQIVEYVTTDVSDRAMAEAHGINHVPRLAEAAALRGAQALTSRVYKFPAGEQIGVFQSSPNPAGSRNTDLAYSPLWRVVMVRWLRAEAVTELKSEEAVLAAEERGDLALEVTDIVINCPVTRSADGTALRGLR